MSGIESCGNSMSTTGPVTRATRPTAVAVFSAVRLMASSLSYGLFARRQSVGAADDLGDLLRDLGLASVVAQARVVGDELVRVVARRLHRLLCRGVLGSRRLEEGVEYAALDVHRQERIQHDARLGLELVQRVDGGTRRLRLDDLQGEQAHGLGRLRHHADEAVVDEVDLVYAAVVAPAVVGVEQDARDLFR